jgi:hypothetical protein
MKMKTIFSKIILIALLLFFAGASCKKRSEPISLLEIKPNSENTIIQYNENQIDFKFCLLNEDNQATTILNEGENFTFSFCFRNISQDTITVTTEFINANFFRVFLTENNIDYGKPWTGVWCEYNGMPQEIKLYPSNDYQLTCPWQLTEKNSPTYPLCMGESKIPLIKGDYYTNIELDFQYLVKGRKFLINQAKFKINFKII